MLFYTILQPETRWRAWFEIKKKIVKNNYDKDRGGRGDTRRNETDESMR